MDLSLSMPLEQLAKGSLLTLRDAQGRGVAVFSGSLWVTQEGDARDIVVHTGDSVRFDRGGLVVIEALADARLLLLDPVRAPECAPWPSAAALHREARRQRGAADGDWLLRLRAWLRRPWARA
jgi:Protein of unknown function (DUF2917)